MAHGDDVILLTTAYYAYLIVGSCPIGVQSCTDGVCTCNDGYTGPDCCQCDSGYFRNPSNEQCEGMVSLNIV